MALIEPPEAIEGANDAVEGEGEYRPAAELPVEEYKEAPEAVDDELIGMQLDTSYSDPEVGSEGDIAIDMEPDDAGIEYYSMISTKTTKNGTSRNIINDGKTGGKKYYIFKD